MAALKNPVVYKNTEIKGRIIEKLDSSLYESSKLCQAINKSSKTRETLHQASKSMASLDSNVMNTHQNLKAMEMTLAKMREHSKKADERLCEIEDLRNKVDSMHRL